MAVLLAVCEICSHIELENHSIAITIASIAEEYTLLKSTFWGYNDNDV